MTDTEFMVHILAEICDYAKANEMDPDDTIMTICGNFIGMLQISSFRNWKGEDSCLVEGAEQDEC